MNAAPPARLVSAPGTALRGSLSLPGDKSLSHRAALLAAVAEGESRIENFLVAGVTRVMLQSLSDLGVSWELEGSSLTVQGAGIEGLRTPAGPLDCGNSATTLRLFAGLLAASGIQAVLDGSAGLRRRPMGRIVEPLRLMGVPVEATPAGTAPLRFAARPRGRRLKPVDYTLPVASAQVKSCLLLAGLGADGATTLHEPAPSRDHTERMLRDLGVPVTATYPAGLPEGMGGQANGPGLRQPVSITIDPPKPVHLPPLRYTLPGDFSAAAFLIVAALITPGSEIQLRGIGLNPTRTGLLEALRAMGADLEVTAVAQAAGEPAGDLRVRASRLEGVSIAGPLVVRMIDEFPIFAVAAAMAEGRTSVRGASELRHKESDRITALSGELRALGVEVVESLDGFEILGGRRFQGGRVHPHGDHRLAMALAVAGLAAQAPVVVQEAEIISESFPGFLALLDQIGAPLRLEV